MHDTSKLTGEGFLKLYSKPEHEILEIGSLDPQNTFRKYMDFKRFVGIDRRPGPNVDLVVDDSGIVPYKNEEFDIVFSSSALEHDGAFWVTFLDMTRVVKQGGFIYISGPKEGPYHGEPEDFWRFKADAAQALMRWSNKLCPWKLRIAETFIVPPKKDIWWDNVMIFGKEPFKMPEPNLQEYLKQSGVL